MVEYNLSINPLAEFVSAKPGRKNAIIRQKKYPNNFIPMWYRSARSSMQKYFKMGQSFDEILDGISRLQNKNPSSDFQRSNTKNSIEALRKFLELQFPDNFRNIKCSFLNVEEKNFYINGVQVRVAPDIVLRIQKNGQNVIGGIKFHISKSSKFTYESAKCAATGLKLFLQETVAKDDEVVDPSYCLSVDVFGERVVQAPDNHDRYLKLLESACDEFKTMLNVA